MDGIALNQASDSTLAREFNVYVLTFRLFTLYAIRYRSAQFVRRPLRYVSVNRLLLLQSAHPHHGGAYVLSVWSLGKFWVRFIDKGGNFVDKAHVSCVRAVFSQDYWGAFTHLHANTLALPYIYTYIYVCVCVCMCVCVCVYWKR